MGCDAVILPYSSSERMKQLYSYHFPSKLPEYLALGMPVIITGPEYATGVRWGKRNPESVITCESENSKKLMALLQNLKTDAILREKMSNGAAEISRKEFNPSKIRARFMEIINSI